MGVEMEALSLWGAAPVRLVLFTGKGLPRREWWWIDREWLRSARDVVRAALLLPWMDARRRSAVFADKRRLATESVRLWVVCSFKVAVEISLQCFGGAARESAPCPKIVLQPQQGCVEETWLPLVVIGWLGPYTGFHHPCPPRTAVPDMRLHI